MSNQKPKAKGSHKLSDVEVKGLLIAVALLIVLALIASDIVLSLKVVGYFDQQQIEAPADPSGDADLSGDANLTGPSNSSDDADATAHIHAWTSEVKDVYFEDVPGEYSYISDFSWEFDELAFVLYSFELTIDNIKNEFALVFAAFDNSNFDDISVYIFDLTNEQKLMSYFSYPDDSKGILRGCTIFDGIFITEIEVISETDDDVTINLHYIYFEYSCDCGEHFTSLEAN